MQRDVLLISLIKRETTIEWGWVKIEKRKADIWTKNSWLDSKKGMI